MEIIEVFNLNLFNLFSPTKINILDKVKKINTEYIFCIRKKYLTYLQTE